LLPAETGVLPVRDGTPAPGRDRDIVPLSELIRDLTVDVDGLGRAKNKFFLQYNKSKKQIFD